MRPLLVASDVHLSHGGSGATSRALGELVRKSGGHELVLAGDIFNLSLDAPSRSAVESVVSMFAEHSELAAALGSHLGAGGALTLIAGNHDAAGMVPELREALLGRFQLGSQAELRVTPWFVRRGKVHVEHGHFYDPDNAPAHPLVAWSPETEALGVAITRRFLRQHDAFDFAHAYETTPLAGLSRAIKLFGARTPLMIARWFSVASKLCTEARDPRRFDAERSTGAERSESFATDAGLDPAMILALLAAGPQPTHGDFGATFMRLYNDRVLATLGLLSGGAARLLVKSRAGSALAVASALYLLSSVARLGNRYEALPVQRLRRAAQRVRELSGAEMVIFGHTHVEDQALGYLNSGSFCYGRARRPYVYVDEHGNAERRYA
ncbi:MAG TPA: metallophosphoesterase [Polyangiaceae bacterium]|jgi:predicted phosphodiesterase